MDWGQPRTGAAGIGFGGEKLKVFARGIRKTLQSTSLSSVGTERDAVPGAGSCTGSDRRLSSPCGNRKSYFTKEKAKGHHWQVQAPKYKVRREEEMPQDGKYQPKHEESIVAKT